MAKALKIHGFMTHYFYNQGAIVEANPNLKAERSISYELGLRGSNEHARFELISTYTDYTDFINETKTGQQGGKRRIY